jgi:uncharacterized protein with FMN-binding domain
MKRLVVTVTGTVAGLAALLSFKAQGHPLANSGALPSAGLPGDTSASSAGPTPAATSSTPSTAGASARKATTAKPYVGSAISTRYGIVQVKINVAGHRITNVAFVQLTAFDQRSQQINSFAAPQLLKETLSAQSAQVDTISGASYTSDGYRQSLQAALDRAGL